MDIIFIFRPVWEPSMFGTASFFGITVNSSILLPLGQALFMRSCHEDVTYSKSAQKYSKSTPKFPKKYSKSTPKVLQKYSKSAPKVLQKYSKKCPESTPWSTPKVPQKYSKKYSKSTPKVPKKYSKSTPKVPQKYSMEYSNGVLH